ncbi:MAG: SGNH/GDSL hydrolase family protein [Dehalococcoidia bacterium]|nr:SGNH/GDSL hydrolase family protein [Dehalococcoidia bacterium]
MAHGVRPAWLTRAAAIVLVAAVLALAANPASSAPSTLPVRAVVPGLAADSFPGQPRYVALGDSLAAGVGASDPFETGYVPHFAHYLVTEGACGGPCPGLAMRNLGTSGATSGDLITEQLPEALAAIRDGGVAAITIDIGANDGVAPLRDCVATGEVLGCLVLASQLIATYQVNLDRILADLRTAGPTVPILVMTYYNPLAACTAAEYAPAAGLVLEGGIGVAIGLNDVIRQEAAEHGALVAETYGQLGPADLLGGEDCLHPNDSGYAIIAAAFEAAWAAR